MKTIFSLLFLLPYIIWSQTLLFQDFNQGFPVGWQLIDNDQNIPNASPSVNFITDAYVIHEDYDSTGIVDSIVVATSWFDLPGSADDYLITPGITLGNNGNVLSFDAKSVDGSYPDGLQVLYSTTDLYTWTFTANDTLFFSESVSNTWTNYSVILDSTLANQTVYFAFRHIGTDQFILGLDNIKVETNSTLGVSENTNNNDVEFYPTPAKNSIRFTGQFTNEPYILFQLDGKIVQQGITNGIIDFNLKSGFYILLIKGTTSKLQVVN